jgi:hypothetical protein
MKISYDPEVDALRITVGSPTLRNKIEEGLKDIRAGRTISLADYTRRRAKLKAKQLLLRHCQSV